MASGSPVASTVYEVDDGYLQQRERAVHDAIAENIVLLSKLEEGKLYIGEYHAQLALDNIALSEVMKQRVNEFEKLEKQAQSLKTQIDFYYRDCKRLSKDNDDIIREGKRKDTELAELYTQLELQNVKHRSSNRALKTTQEQQKGASQLALKAQEQFRSTKDKLIRQHEHMWELQDRIDALNAEIAELESIAYSQRRASKKEQCALGADKARNLTLQAPQGALCLREDCVLLRKQLQQVNAEINAVAIKRRASVARGMLSSLNV